MLRGLLFRCLETMAWPLALFVWHPRQIAFVAVSFLVLYWLLRGLARIVPWVRPWPVLVPTVLWGVWTLWECMVSCHSFPHGGAILRPLWEGLVLGHIGGGGGEIRIDLLAIIPLLLVTTPIGLAACIRWRAIGCDSAGESGFVPELGQDSPTAAIEKLARFAYRCNREVGRGCQV